MHVLDLPLGSASRSVFEELRVIADGEVIAHVGNPGPNGCHVDRALVEGVRLPGISLNPISPL